MTNWPYNRDIPLGANNPSNDRPLMTQNTNSTDSLIAEDHISFGVENGGFHKQSRYTLQTGKPLGLIADSGTAYVKSVPMGTPTFNSNQLFFTNGNNINALEYQLTRTDTPNRTTFSTNTKYSLPGYDGTGGWTFIPGGLVLMYGTTPPTSGSGSVSVPFPYPANRMSSIYSLTLAIVDASPNSLLSYSYSGLSTSGFTARSSQSGKTFTWMAIGI
jgi:hypothetical protein